MQAALASARAQAVLLLVHRFGRNRGRKNATTWAIDNGCARVSREVAMTGKNRIIIYDPKEDGTYVIEFRTSEGEALAISSASGHAAAPPSVAKNFRRPIWLAM